MDIDTSKRPVITKSGVGLEINEHRAEFTIYKEVYEDANRVKPLHETDGPSVTLENDSLHVMIQLGYFRGAGGDAGEQYIDWPRADMPSNATLHNVKETPVHYQVIDGRGIRVRLPEWFFAERGTAATT